MPVWIWATAAPALPLIALAVALRPDMSAIPVPIPTVPARCGCCPAHRAGVPVARNIRRLAAEAARRPRPIGWQSPAWTVEVTTR